MPSAVNFGTWGYCPPGSVRLGRIRCKRIVELSPWWKWWRPRKLITNLREVFYTFSFDS